MVTGVVVVVVMALVMALVMAMMALAMVMVALAMVMVALAMVDLAMVVLAMVVLATAAAILAPMVLRMVMLPLRLHPYNQQHRLVTSNPASNPVEPAQGCVGSFSPLIHQFEYVTLTFSSLVVLLSHPLSTFQTFNPSVVLVCTTY